MVRFIGPIIGLQAMMYFLSQKHFLPVLVVIGLLCGFLFFICMYTQHQLILSKPSSSSTNDFVLCDDFSGRIFRRYSDQLDHSA